MNNNKVRLRPHKVGTLVRCRVDMGAAGFSYYGLCIVTEGTRKELKWTERPNKSAGWDRWQTVYSFRYRRHFNFQIENMIPVDGSG